MGRASTDGQRKHARNTLIKRLAEYSLSWSNNLSAILAADWFEAHPTTGTPSGSSVSPDVPDVNVFDLNRRIIERRVVLTKAQYTVAALWTLNTYTYDLFEHAPELGAVAPASGCGKSTLRRVLKALADDSWHSDHATPAVVYRTLLENPRQTLFFDEAENQNLLHNNVLRAIIDAAFQPDGSRDLIIDGRPVKVRLFAPVFWALRGEIFDVPLAILSRAFVLHLNRGKPEVRFLRNDPDFLKAREQNAKWAATCSLDPNPQIPGELSFDERVADICRPLLSIADSLGRGAEARDALIEVCAGRINQDPGILLLLDARKVFDMFDVDRITKDELLRKVIEFGDVFWTSWRGTNDRDVPHQLGKIELSSLLRRFGIRSHTVWPTPRDKNSKSSDGYYREQFEEAWRKYCSETTTPTQTRKIMMLA
jgi:hypothetical protein